MRNIVKCHYTTYTIAISGILQGPWLGLHGPSGHYMAPHGYSSTHYCHQMIMEPHPSTNKRVSENAGFSKMAKYH